MNEWPTNNLRCYRNPLLIESSKYYDLYVVIKHYVMEAVLYFYITNDDLKCYVHKEMYVLPIFIMN